MKLIVACCFYVIIVSKKYRLCQKDITVLSRTAEMVLKRKTATAAERCVVGLHCFLVFRLLGCPLVWLGLG